MAELVRVPLTNILIAQLVSETDTLRLVLDRLAIDDGCLKLLNDTAMDSVTLRALLVQWVSLRS